MNSTRSESRTTASINVNQESCDQLDARVQKLKARLDILKELVKETKQLISDTRKERDTHSDLLNMERTEEERRQSHGSTVTQANANLRR